MFPLTLHLCCRTCHVVVHRFAEKEIAPPPTAPAVHAQRQDFRGYCTGHIRAPIPSAPLRLHAHWLALCLTLGGQHLLLLVPVFRLLKPVVCLCTGTPTVKCLKMYLLWWQPATNSQHTQGRCTPQLSCSSLREILRQNLHYFQHVLVDLNEGPL